LLASSVSLFVRPTACSSVVNPVACASSVTGPVSERIVRHAMFVGDTLFAGSIGRTDLPGGDYPTLIESIRTVLFAFGDDARVYPGHGPATTIGKERRGNPFLQIS
jgi:hypothetical protein